MFCFGAVYGWVPWPSVLIRVLPCFRPITQCIARAIFWRCDDADGPVHLGFAAVFEVEFEAIGMFGCVVGADVGVEGSGEVVVFEAGVFDRDSLLIAYLNSNSFVLDVKGECVIACVGVNVTGPVTCWQVVGR